MSAQDFVAESLNCSPNHSSIIALGKARKDSEEQKKNGGLR